MLRNEAIVTIIDTWPTHLKQLSDLRVLRPQHLKDDGKVILNILKQAQESAEADPPKPIQLPLHVYNSAALKRLKSIGKEIAKKENLLPELLIRRRDIEKLINSKDDQGGYHLPPSLQGWRKALLADKLLDALKKIDNQPVETQET